MRIIIAIASLLYLLSGTSTAQTPDKNITLAINGLNLRAAPDKGAAVLTSIPFKSTVEFISCDDILVSLPDMYRTIEENNLVDKALEGYWVRVRYQQHTGYVFSAFLGSAYSLDMLTGYTYPAIFGAEANGQWMDYRQAAPDMNNTIYGAYDDNGYLAFEKVSMLIFADKEGYILTALNLKRNYLLVFTTGQQLPAGMPRRKVLGEEFGYASGEILDARHKELLAAVGLAYPGESIISASSTKDPVYQLNRDCPTSGTQSNLLRLIWFGDLDGDSRNDYFYYLDNTIEMTSQVCLWLSSDMAMLTNEFCYYYSADPPYYLVPGYYFTIARSGLNMRATSKPDAPVIQKIPYGERVLVLDERQQGMDTLSMGGIRYYGNFDTRHPENNTADTVYVVGARTRISYKGKTGYVHSSYLCDFPQSAPEGSFFYMSLYHSRYYYHPDWYYYGLYWEDDRYILKKITPSIFSSIFWSEIAEGYVISLSVLGNEKNIYPAYVFGSKKPLQEGFKGVPLAVDTWMDFSTADDAILEKLRLEVTAGDHSDGVRRVFAVRKNGLRQEIVFKRPYAQDDLFNGNLEWYGDLDGDGEWDYIFSFFGECGTDDFLYMSSEGGKGKILAPSYRQIVPCGC